MCNKVKVLFICKKRKSSGPGPYANMVSSGLLNSATFVNDMLVKSGIDSDIIEVIDNNDIDREVHKFDPTHVIIEALWVVPSKFEVLQKLHPNVKWIIRLHSETPFLANEGIAMNWVYEYMKFENVFVSVNSTRIEREFNELLPKKPIYLPNYYPVSKVVRTKQDECGVIQIGCFGAIRPLKNQLLQAMSAIEFANQEGLILKYHINGTRIENNGDPVLKNIRSLFENNPKHELIEHTWMTHDEFIVLLSSMDLCMQVSFSETYNIVTADSVNNLIPVVVSPEIHWVFGLFKANPVNSKSIVRKIGIAYYLRRFGLEWLNKALLWWNSFKSKTIWIEYFDQESECGICGYTSCTCDNQCSNCNCQ